MSTSTEGILQTAATIAKTTETNVGGLLDVAIYDRLTLWLDYVKGDETGLNVYIYFLKVGGGTAYELTEWETSSGVYTNTDQKLQFTANASTYVTFDVSGVELVQVKQGGSNNDGTPTGTLAVSYTLKAG